MRHITVLVVFPLSFGFLLDTKTPQNLSSQFITASEFFAAKTGLQNGIEESRYETNDLRHDVDRKLVVLTSQVQQMFESLQQQILKKETNQSDEILQKYQELSENYTALHKRFDVLQANQISQIDKLSKCEIKVNEHVREILALKDSEIHQNARVNTSIAKLQQQINKSSAKGL